jgi:hypothetical protein
VEETGHYALSPFYFPSGLILLLFISAVILSEVKNPGTLRTTHIAAPLHPTHSLRFPTKRNAARTQRNYSSFK